MKKQLLILLALSLCFSGYAQNRKGVKSVSDLKPLSNAQPVAVKKAVLNDYTLPVTLSSNILLHQAAKASGGSQAIGSSVYDLQTNGSCSNRIYNNGSTLGAAWTFSTDLAGAYPDRGTAVNNSSDNGVTWGTFPTARVETERRGFGTLDKLGSGECVISHASASVGPVFVSRPTAGTGSWTQTNLPTPVGVSSLWPRVRVAGSNGTTVHAILVTTPVGNGGSLYNGLDGAFVYYRSLDGGNNWDQQYIQLPGSDSSLFLGYSGDGYALDANGDNVAILYGDVTDDLILWKSTDNGSTWTKTIVLDFPFTKYSESTMNTDVDGDGTADTVLTTDGAVSVVIDNNGMVHCFAGAMLVFEDIGGTAIGLFLDVDGLMYWNEGMGASLPVVIATSPDRDASGTWDYAPNTFDGVVRYGNDNITSMPSAGVDAFNNIYVSYSTIMELTDDGTGHSYRNTWAMASEDGGANWLTPFNVSNSDFDEGVFGSVARDVEAPGCLHLIYQVDAAPGNGVQGMHALTNNDIVYNCVDPVVDLGVTVGISENTVANNISLFPNPAVNMLNINYDLVKAANIKVNLVNTLGQVVASSETKTLAGKAEIKFNVKNLASGIYAVNSTIDGTVYTSKVVVE